MGKNTTVTVLFVLFFLYGIIFILNSGFTVSGKLHFSCFDDAMITLNYARNIVRGNGFVWYPGGEKVEGASSPLWVIVTAATHLILDSDRYTPGLVQLVSLIFLLIGIIWLYRLGMLLTEGDVFLSLATSAITFFYSGLFYWCVMGLEVSLAFALVSITLFEGARELKLEKTDTLLICVLLALLILTRNELLVFCVFFLIIIKVTSVKDLVSPGFLLGMLAIFLTVVGISLFRLLYFNEILPNTYYLKMTGFPLILRMSRGLYIAILFLKDLSIPLLLVYACGVFALVHKHGARVTILLSIPLFMYMGYSIYIGGDAWEHRGGANRWISPFMGLFVICVVFGCAQILESALLQLLGKSSHRLQGSAHFKKTLYWVLLLAVYLQMNLCGKNPVFPMIEMLMLRKPMGATVLREQIMIGDTVSEITHKEAKIALIIAGTIPYHTEDRQFVDLFGYNDKILSRGQGHVKTTDWSKYVEYGPGLAKYDLAYSVGKLQPDVIVNLVGHAIVEFEKQYGSYYRRLIIDLPELNKTALIWLRKDSPKLNKEELLRRGIAL